MIKKDLLLTFITMILLGWSFAVLSDERSYDCTTPILSDLSSCTFYGASCSKKRNHPGIVGLLSSAGIFKKVNENNLVPTEFHIECEAPGCRHSKECYYINRPYSTPDTR